MKLKSHNSQSLTTQNYDEHTLKYSKISSRGALGDNNQNNKDKKTRGFQKNKNKDVNKSKTNITVTYASVYEKQNSIQTEYSQQTQKPKSTHPKNPKITNHYVQPTLLTNQKPQMCPQVLQPHLQPYHSQIHKYLQSYQHKFKIQSSYLRHMENITYQHRATFVKHFFKLAKKFQFKRTTLYLAVYYMDAYFQKNLTIGKREAVIAAQACMFIASKYQEIYPPDLYQWCQSIKQIIQAQSQILKCLDFALCHHTLQHHLDYYLHLLSPQVPHPQRQMIKLIADVSLFDQSLYTHPRAQLALSIIYSVICRGELEQKVEMSLKWMIERNQGYMEWLQALQMGKTKKRVY